MGSTIPAGESLPQFRRILELLGPREMASEEVVEAIGAEFGITQAAELSWRYGLAGSPYLSRPLRP